MERGFFHHDIGYWQTTATPSAATIAAYPDGTVEVPLKPGADYQWINGAWAYVTPTPPPPTTDAVNTERDRRVRAGATFTITGYAQPIPTSGDQTSRENLTNLGVMAQALIAASSTDSLPFRDDDNVIHYLTPTQMFELWQLGVSRVSAIYEASWALKDDANGIPEDYADDTHWPSTQ